MPYNFVAYSIHTNKVCSRLSSGEVHFLTENGHSASLSPPLFRGNVCSLSDRLIRKCALHFLLVIIEPFSLGVTAEALRANID